MGGRGSFNSGKQTPHKWVTDGKREDFKSLKYKQGKTMKLPEESHSPHAKYVHYDDETGRFKMLRVYNKDRLPILEIALGPHQGRMALHWHRLDGNVANRGKTKGKDWDWLHPGDTLYKRYETIIEGGNKRENK